MASATLGRMDPKNGAPMMMAPPASASSPLRCPGRDEPLWPRLDDHLVVPEVSREEVVRGVRYEAMAALPDHGDPHCQLDYVIRGHVAPGYVASTDMLTRFSVGSDFAPDTCIRRVGKDPETGTFYLEEVAFEVVNEQRLTGPTGINTKSEDMKERGVRRVFGIFVKEGQVKEWLGHWKALPIEGTITDRCLAPPLPVKAILDAAAADLAVLQALLARNSPQLDNAAAQALIDKGNPVIGQVRTDEQARGLREAVLDLCEVLNVEVTARRQLQLEQMDLGGLQTLRAYLKQHRAWPAG